MAGEEPRVAQAYIDIEARKGDRFREQVRTIGEEYGTEAGTSAGKEFDEGFHRQAVSPTSKRRRQSEGTELGKRLGDAAGLAAGLAAPKGITEGLRRAAPALAAEGDVVGQVIGATAGRRAAVMTRAALNLELKAAAKEAGLAAKAVQKEAGLVARAAAAETKAAAREAAQAEADFKARMDRIQKRGAQVARGISRPLLGGSGIVGRATSVVGVGATAATLSGLGTGIGGTVSAVSALSGLVGPLGAGLAAAGVGAGTLAIGIHGVGDAIAETDTKKFNEDIKGLSPNAREFAREVRGMRGELGDLKDSVQDALFAGLAKDVGDLADRYLPLAEKGLTRVSKAMNAGARDVADFLDTKGAGNQLTSILDNIGLSADQLAPALRPAVRALLDFVDAGSDFLPEIADDITRISDRFSDFIHDAKDSGGLGEFFRDGITAGKDLLHVTENVGRAVGGIFHAGTSGDSSALKTLADLTDRIADQVNKPAFQAGLSDFFGAIRDAGDSVGGALPDVADALVALEPAAAKFVRGSGTALASIMEDAASAAEDLAPFLNTLGSAFQSVAPHATTFLVAALALKGGLGALKAALALNEFLERLDGLGLGMERTGRHAQVARGRIAGFSGALGAIGTAATVVSVAAVANEIGAASGRADVATVKVLDLSSALGDLGRGGEIGAAGLKVLGTGGLFGLIKNPADDSADALDKFGTAAYNALDKGWDARLGRWQSFGQAQGAFRKQTEQLDGAFTDLASHGQIEDAATSFEKFLKAGKDAGVPVASLKAQFPEFSARLAAAGLTVDNTTGKVTNLDGALRSLPSSKTIRVQGVGLVQAITSAEVLADRLRNIPKNVIARVQTQYIDVFASEVARDNARARNHGPFTGGLIDGNGVLRRYQAGGLIDPRLGGPRQDNVLLRGSGGEFMTNAYATSQPGVLSVLSQINTLNKLPDWIRDAQGFASGGKVGSVASHASVGLNDLSVSQTLNRTVRTTHPDPPQQTATSARLHPDDIAALGRVLASAVREQKVVLSTGELTGAVMRQAGSAW